MAFKSTLGLLAIAATVSAHSLEPRQTCDKGQCYPKSGVTFASPYGPDELPVYTYPQKDTLCSEDFNKYPVSSIGRLNPTTLTYLPCEPLIELPCGSFRKAYFGDQVPVLVLASEVDCAETAVKTCKKVRVPGRRRGA